jgi:soluble lytic murein transglycosylase-like protein
MADQDQQQAIPERLPGSAFQLAAPSRLPGYFLNLSPQQQADYMQHPDDLPADLPQRSLRLGLKALPYAGAALATMALPEGLPWYWAALGASGLAAAGGATGEAAKQGVYSLTGMPEAAPTAGEFGRRVAGQAVEQGLTELGTRTVVTGPLEWWLKKNALNAQRWYESALMPAGGRETEAQKAVMGGLRQGIVLKSDLETFNEASKLYNKFSQDAERMIAASPTDIPAQDYVANIQKRFDILRKQWGRVAGYDYVGELDAIEKDWLIKNSRQRPYYKTIQGQQVLQDPKDMSLAELRQYAGHLPAMEAQQAKQAAYEAVRAHRSPSGTGTIPGWVAGTHPPHLEAAQQELGAAMMEELELRYPGLHNVNRDTGEMAELRKAVDRYVLRENRKRMFSGGWWFFPVLGGAMSGGAGHLAGAGPAGAGAAAVPGIIAGKLFHGLIEDPEVKSKIGIALYRWGQKPAAALVGRAARALPGAAARYLEYQAEEPPRQEPKEQWIYSPASTLQSTGPFIGLPEVPEPAKPAPTRSAAEPPPEQIRPEDRPVYEREREMRGRAYPLYGWQPGWVSMLNQSSQTVGVPLAQLHALAAQEATGRAAEKAGIDPNLIRSKKKAIGLMQVRPQTAAQFGYTERDLEDPRKNIDAAARFIKYLNAKPEYRNKPGLILAAYNAGEGAVRAADYKVYNMSKETRDYVRDGLKLWAQLGLPADQSDEFISAHIPEQ